MASLNLRPATTLDYRELAKKRLPRPLFDYIDGGSYNEVTLKANVADFEKLMVKQKVMCDVSKIDTKTTLIDEKWSIPIGLAPVGLAGMMSRRAEVQAAKQAEIAGIPFCLSTVSICSLEEIAQATSKPFWFQLYMLKDRDYVTDLLGRAKAVGCKTLIFTVDLSVVGARYRDIRNGIDGGLSVYGKLRAALEYPLHPKWAYDVGIKGKPHLFGNLHHLVPSAKSLVDFKSWVGEQFDASCTWDDIKWLRKIWDGNLIIKGILSPEDAQLAVEAGADAVVVSNHGGRQLDGVSSTINMTSSVREKVGDKTTIIMDGGVRNGQDVLKAIASGADSVLIGRPWIWALAAQGEKGLHDLLETFKAEMTVSMALTGVTNISEITNKLLDNFSSHRENT